MPQVLTRLAGLLVFVAGCASFRAVPALIQHVYASGPTLGPAAGVALFIGSALLVIALVMVGVPLLLAGVYAMLFRLRA